MKIQNRTEQRVSIRCSGVGEGEAERVEGVELDAALRLDSCVDSLTWKAEDRSQQRWWKGAGGKGEVSFQLTLNAVIQVLVK